MHWNGSAKPWQVASKGHRLWSKYLPRYGHSECAGILTGARKYVRRRQSVELPAETLSVLPRSRDAAPVPLMPPEDEAGWAPLGPAALAKEAKAKKAAAAAAAEEEEDEQMPVKAGVSPDAAEPSPVEDTNGENPSPGEEPAEDANGEEVGPPASGGPSVPANPAVGGEVEEDTNGRPE